MNLFWGFMILSGILFGAAAQNMQAVTDAILQSAKDALSLGFSMAAMLSLWSGMMEIARESGIIDSLTRKLSPFLTFFFPNIPKNHPSREYLSTNIISNILGLGMAATPAGLKAIEELKNLEQERRANGQKAMPKGTASDEMCCFLILNISSLQLIPVNILAYRSQFGSANPAAIVGPAILATAISTLTAIFFCKMIYRKHQV